MRIGEGSSISFNSELNQRPLSQGKEKLGESEVLDVDTVQLTSEAVKSGGNEDNLPPTVPPDGDPGPANPPPGGRASSVGSLLDLQG